MKKVFSFFFVSILLISCSSVKKTQKAINYGNYNEAINIAIKNLRVNKRKKGNQSYVLLLEEAFAKAVTHDKERINFLKKDGNATNLESIYNLYTQLNNRQEKIKPLLPLQIINKGRNAEFKFKNYSSDIVTAKNNLSEYLYNNAKNKLKTSQNKIDFRHIFDDLNYLSKINPNYRNTNSLLEEAHYKGTDFVFVSLENKTNKVIPKRLENDLLNFNTYKLNNLWTIYNTVKQPQQPYDYLLKISFKEINISPEELHEKVIIQEKQIKDGWQYLVDNNGNEVKDSLGNTIKVDRFKTIRSKVRKYSQFKSVQVVGQINYFDLATNQLLKSFPLSSEFVFENHFATFSGNKKAINKNNLDFIRNKRMPFPSNEQMIYDSGENLKKKIKYIIYRLK
ncbi:MAG: hypothetical protein QM486_10895 [Flavobacteriaceae bacterium]